MNQTARAHAWSQDSYVDYKPNATGTWKVVGNHSGFIYKDNLTHEAARKYSTELNLNKQHNQNYPEN